MAEQTEERYSSLGEVSFSDEEKAEAMVSWVMTRVKSWREYRDNNFKDRWDEYYRLWRGVWDKKDAQRMGERSKLIVPALQQAIEASVSELEEATFGRGRWFDTQEDSEALGSPLSPTDEEIIPYGEVRDRLEEDFREAGIEDSVAEVFLNGALYGTGIGKIIVSEVVDTSITAQTTTVGNINFTSPAVATKTKTLVELEAISPRDFVIDTNARNINEALGCAHENITPAHIVIDKQKKGEYRDVSLGNWSESRAESELGESGSTEPSEDRVLITEYHGLVPAAFLPDEEQEDVLDPTGLVEAIITIGNEEVQLKAVRNVLLMEDRGFISFQYDTVPNRFWGRGIAEKGYNPQKALDTELRARIDGLALTVHPMMAGDVTRLPRGTDLRVRPGKSVLVNGNPKDVLMPFNFGTLDPNIFRDSADLERMVQMGTGGVDSAAQGQQAARASTGGLSIVQGGLIKRSKRTMQNIERQFLEPLIRKCLWRYIQFEEGRYPAKDYKFKVTASLGILAREFESTQMAALLQTIPPGSPGYWLILQTIFENTTVSNRDEMVGIIRQQLAGSLQPPEGPSPDELEAQAAVREAEAKLAAVQAKAQNDRQKLALERDKLIQKERQDQRKTELEEDRIKAQLIMDSTP